MQLGWGSQGPAGREVRRDWPWDPPSWLSQNSDPYGVMEAGSGVSGQSLTNWGEGIIRGSQRKL